jgi:hypothetical protein
VHPAADLLSTWIENPAFYGSSSVCPEHHHTHRARCNRQSAADPDRTDEVEPGTRNLSMGWKVRSLNWMPGSDLRSAFE